MGQDRKKKPNFFAKMSTRITFLISAIVFVTVVVQFIAASNRASNAMEETYLNYAQNLAAEAAKTIGANALLVRTGALYHDIGKTVDPLYYVENQNGVENPLLKMDPRDAAQVVISHVTEGERIARKNHLPEVVINFITTHHGTSLVRYFYNTYCNTHPNEAVDESLFRYQGAKPSTKEGAILMMADAVEARSRSLTDFSEGSIAKAVNQMIDAQIADGQFAETPLSFKDVEDIRRVFVTRLTAMNHHRISYPTLKK